MFNLQLVNHNWTDGLRIRCPCSMCKNQKFIETENVKFHLVQKDFVVDYYEWRFHGETTTCTNYERGEGHTSAYVTESPDRYHTLVRDVSGLDLDFDTMEESPNPIAKKLYEMLQAANQALWPKCEKHSQLSAVARLLNIKSEYHLLERCYDSLLEFMKEALPQRSTLSENFYDTRKMVEGLGFSVEKIDCCEQGCMIYWGVDRALRCCKLCGHPRYKCKTRENFKFKFFKKKKKGKTVIYRNSSEKSWDFSRSRMTKRIAPLESSREI